MVRGRKKNKHVGYHVVAFIDLMGQQELLRNLTDLPELGNDEKREEFINKLKDTYGAVKTVRESINKFIGNFAKQKPSFENIPKEKRASFRELKNNPIRIKQFSDFVLAFLSLRNDTGAKLPVRGIFAILGACGTTQLISLASGQPLRGGIDIGVNIEIKHDEIYGSALARTYALESHIANYPRIVIGSELKNYLTQTSNNSANDDISRVSSATARLCLNMLAVDNDGYPFVDFLGSYFQQENDKLNLGNDFVKRAYNFVVEACEKYKSEQNTKLAFKYALLRTYMESRIHLWGVERV